MVCLLGIQLIILLVLLSYSVTIQTETLILISGRGSTSLYAQDCRSGNRVVRVRRIRISIRKRKGITTPY